MQSCSQTLLFRHLPQNCHSEPFAALEDKLREESLLANNQYTAQMLRFWLSMTIKLNQFELIIIRKSVPKETFLCRTG